MGLFRKSKEKELIEALRQKDALIDSMCLQMNRLQERVKELEQQLGISANTQRDDLKQAVRKNYNKHRSLTANRNDNLTSSNDRMAEGMIIGSVLMSPPSHSQDLESPDFRTEPTEYSCEKSDDLGTGDSFSLTDSCGGSFD